MLRLRYINKARRPTRGEGPMGEAKGHHSSKAIINVLVKKKKKKINVLVRGAQHHQ